MHFLIFPIKIPDRMCPASTPTTTPATRWPSGSLQPWCSSPPWSWSPESPSTSSSRRRATSSPKSAEASGSVFLTAQKGPEGLPQNEPRIKFKSKSFKKGLHNATRWFGRNFTKVLPNCKIRNWQGLLYAGIRPITSVTWSFLRSLIGQIPL